MSMPTKAVVLFDQTGIANSAFDTGFLDTADFDALYFAIVPVGGTLAAVAVVIAWNNSGADRTIKASTLTAASSIATGAVGLGTDSSAVTNGAPQSSAPLPAETKISVAALGVGVQARIIVYGRRHFRGSVPNTNTLDGITPRALD